MATTTTHKVTGITAADEAVTVVMTAAEIHEALESGRWVSVKCGTCGDGALYCTNMRKLLPAGWADQVPFAEDDDSDDEGQDLDADETWEDWSDQAPSWDEIDEEENR